METNAHSVTFDISMADKDFLKWLKSKGMNQKDSKALSGNFKVPMISAKSCIKGIAIM